MTNPTPAKAVRKTGASRNSKVLSATLAVATGVGVSGMVVVRMATDASAQDTTTVSNDQGNELATSSDGYTKDQLDAYAQALDSEATRLQDYRDQLTAAATKFQAKAIPKVKSKPVTQPKAAKAAPAPKTQEQKSAPQSKSESS
jgi:hypothetical protein